MNKRQVAITTAGIVIISVICIYCLMEYSRLERFYPRGTYKFQETTKTKKIRTLFFTLGLYTIFAAAGTGTLIYIARTKADNVGNDGEVKQAEAVDKVDDFVKRIHTADDIEREMRRLDNLKAKGKISDEEYNKMVNEIFERV